MFPYRRQGPKKRKGNPPRRGRGPTRPLPNSARELIPILQPTTKALAQVLAGRSNDAGQLAHAQAVLAHAERLVADRQANRLNPAEREELLEQIARLKLTIADAESEAESELEDEEVQRPAPSVVDRERLREMALTLGTPRPPEAARPVSSAPPPAVTPSDAAPANETDPKEPPAEGPSELPPKSEHNQRAGRLQLSASGGEAAATAVTLRGPMRRRAARPPTRLKPVAAEPAATPEPAPPQADPTGAAPPADSPAEQYGAGNGNDSGGKADRSAPPRANPADGEDGARRKGIPEGWVIDDEGYVVPGPA